MTEPRLAVVTGAGGFIGSHLVRRFQADGWRVRALMHSDREDPSPGVSYQVWDLGDAIEPSLLDGADVLIHAAFAKYDAPDASGVNLEGSRRLLDAAGTAGVGRTVFLSSMSARDGALNQYGKDKFVIQGWFENAGGLAVRPGLVLGDVGLFLGIRRFVTSHRIVPLVGGGQRLQTLHIDDLCSAILAGLERGISGVVTVAEPDPITFRELLGETARLTGTRVRFVPVPYAPVSWALRVASLLGVRLPVSPDNLAGLRGLQTTDVRDDLRGLGINVRDYRASLRAIVANGD